MQRTIPMICRLHIASEFCEFSRAQQFYSGIGLPFACSSFPLCLEQKYVLVGNEATKSLQATPYFWIHPFITRICWNVCLVRAVISICFRLLRSRLNQNLMGDWVSIFIFYFFLYIFIVNNIYIYNAKSGTTKRE